MPLLLVFAFIVVPIAEIYVLVQVGQAIGVLPTIALLLLDSVLGAWLLRREGRKAWAAFRRALEERRLPAREVADGALVLFGGALLLTPGFLSDILGLLCILPPTRAGLRAVLTGLVGRRLGVVGLAPGATAAGRRRAAQDPSPYGDVIDGEVVDLDTEQGPPPGGRRPLDGSGELP
jgi:UPF0716 protein FxsA